MIYKVIDLRGQIKIKNHHYEMLSVMRRQQHQIYAY